MSAKATDSKRTAAIGMENPNEMFAIKATA
jgi:hypothetical protein